MHLNNPHIHTLLILNISAYIIHLFSHRFSKKYTQVKKCTIHQTVFNIYVSKLIYSHALMESDTFCRKDR